MIRRTPGLVELHPSRFAARVDKACDKARAADADAPAGEVTRDCGQLILLPHPLLMACEAKRRKAADNDEEYRNGPHRQRIGTKPDGLDGLL